MVIDKTANSETNYKNQEYYYNSARDGMFDVFDNMNNAGLIDTIFLPGYIGWSPKEGSGIFDPINKLEGISIEYYKMTSDLSIDIGDLSDRIHQLKNKKFAVLVVNYFGFVDEGINNVVELIKRNSGWIISDNAHGFFTYQHTQDNYSDAMFFSLHKMFPFKNGGSLLIKNNQLKSFKYSGGCTVDNEINPWAYDIKNISGVRLENYILLQDIIQENGDSEYFVPLKASIPSGNIPQTFPVKIKKGDRDQIYELMNKAGYGVVSLYHTLIEPLQYLEYEASLGLSRCIMNLPVHQDVDTKKYKDMIKLLIKYCKETNESD